MKRLLFVLGVVLIPAALTPARISPPLSTAAETRYAWSLVKAQDKWLLAFPPGPTAAGHGMALDPAPADNDTPPPAPALNGSHENHYRVVILATSPEEDTGLPAEISVVVEGNADSDRRKSTLSESGTAPNSLSGQIGLVPAPGSVLLVCLGIVLVGWFRVARHL
jgi:hypothetical protein